MKRFLTILIKLILTALIMIFLIRKLRMDQILDAFQNPSQPVWLVLAAVLVIPNLIVQWYRWHYLLRLIQPDIPASESISSFFGGVTVGSITPGRLGEFGRALFLKKVNRMQALGLMLVDKIYATAPVIIGGVWGIGILFFYQTNYRLFIVLPLIFIGLIITLVIVLIVRRPGVIRSFLYQITVLLPFRDKMKLVLESLDKFGKEQARPFIFLSSIFYVIYILQFCFLGFAFQSMELTSALSATMSTMFAKAMLPISFGDLGIREGASIYFFMQFGISKITAFNAALLLFILNVFIPSIIGLVFLPKLTFVNKKSQSK